MKAVDIAKKLKQQIETTTAKIDFMENHMTYCPDHPYEYTHTKADVLISNICRYSKRTLYYASLFSQNLNNILGNIGSVDDKNLPIMIPISDKIFYDFDSFVFSLKSITEGDLLKKSKSFDKQHCELIFKYARKVKDEFIVPYLKPVRNEIVHMKHYGTATGSMMQISDINDISIKCNYRNLENEQLDLISLFIFFFNQTIEIIETLIGIFISYNFKRWGIPTEDATFNSRGIKLKHSDFSIPGYCGITKLVGS